MPGLRVDSQIARELNRTVVFDLLRTRRIISRVDLARESGLSKATISEIVDQFIQEGFVRTLGPAQTARGRRPVLLEFEPRARLAIGVEFSPTGCTAVLTDLNGEVVRLLAAPTRLASADDALDTAIDLIADLVKGMREDGSPGPGGLIGIGVGAPGMIDPRDGTIQNAPSLGWRNIPVGPRLASRFSVPVVVVNHAKAAALGEAWCGAGRQVDNLAYLLIGPGAASGIVIDGHLYRGISLSEGEIAHVTVLPDGPLCHCGNRGCLRALASTSAILSQVREQLRARGESRPLLEHALDEDVDPLALEEVGRLAAVGDPLVTDVLGDVARYIGIAAANLVNILNPEMLVLGGTVIHSLPTLLPAVEAEIRRRAVPISAANLAVVPARLEHEAVPVGAAAYLLSEISVVGFSSVRPLSLRAAGSIRPRSAFSHLGTPGAPDA